MFWIIGNTTQMDQEFQADLKRLSGNAGMNGQLAPQLYDHDIASVTTPLTTALASGESVYVLAHAGHNDGQPWIDGRATLGEFAGDMTGKFTAASLSNRTIWFLVCLVGRQLETLANLLSAAGVRPARLYMPSEYMYISSAGIPHCLEHVTDSAIADKQVAKYDAEYTMITDSLGTGLGWAGYEIDATGTVTRIGGADVQQAVIDRFDREENEAS